jgi:hypothetical protein
MNDKVTDERLKQLSTMSWVSNFQYEAKRMATELLSLRHPAPCVWTKDADGYYVTGCKCGLVYNGGCYIYCPYCGHPIEAKKGDDMGELCPKCAIGYYLPSGVCDHCNQPREAKHWRHTDGKLTCKTVNDVVTECTIPQWVSNIIDWNWAWTLIDIGEYERSKTPAPTSVAGAGAARLAGVDIEPAVDEAWINVPDYPGSSNKIQRAIEQLQRRVEALGLKNK